MSIVRAESIPESTIEYGTSMYFITNEIGINLLTAQGIHLAPDASHTTIMLAIQFIIALIALVGAWAFLRNFMNPVWVSFVIINLSWLRHINFKLGLYRAESAGIAIFFISLLCIHKSFEGRKIVWAGLTGIGIGLTSIIHGVPGLILIL